MFLGGRLASGAKFPTRSLDYFPLHSSVLLKNDQIFFSFPTLTSTLARSLTIWKVPFGEVEVATISLGTDSIEKRDWIEKMACDSILILLHVLTINF